jgi:hypothetical protein
VDPEFGHTSPDRLYIAEIPKFEPHEASRDFGCRLAIAQLLEPLPKSVGLANLDHASTTSDTRRSCQEDVAYKRQWRSHV